MKTETYSICKHKICLCVPADKCLSWMTHSVSLWHSKCDLWFNCICTGFLKLVTLPIYLELFNAGRASLDKWYTKFWWILIKTGTFPISGEEWFEPTDSRPYQGCQNYTYSKITSQRLKVKSSLQVSLYGLYGAFKVLSYQCFSGRIFGIKIHSWVTLHYKKTYHSEPTPSQPQQGADRM